MKLKYYQISIRYENKMHDFHGWGVAVQELLATMRNAGFPSLEAA